MNITTDGMKITSSSGERWLVIPYSIGSTDDFKLSFIYTGGYFTICTVELSSTYRDRHLIFWNEIFSNPTNWKCANNGSESVFSNVVPQIGDKITLRRENGVNTLKLNNTVLITDITNNNSGYIAFETYSKDSRWTQYKDITLAIL